MLRVGGHLQRCYRSPNTLHKNKIQKQSVKTDTNRDIFDF